jgi:hypothetical protein
MNGFRCLLVEIGRPKWPAISRRRGGSVLPRQRRKVSRVNSATTVQLGRKLRHGRRNGAMGTLPESEGESGPRA